MFKGNSSLIRTPVVALQLQCYTQRRGSASAMRCEEYGKLGFENIPDRFGINH